MAMKKGPKMIEDLVRRRACGAGFQTIAGDLRISRNTVKRKLKAIGAYGVDDAKSLLANGFSCKQISSSFAPHWSDKIGWKESLAAVEGGTPIKEYWEVHVKESSSVDLQNVPYETFWREFRRHFPEINIHYHKQHEPGLRCEIDYKGDTHGLGYIDKSTGEFIECRLFGQVLCHSRLFFPFATLDEKQPSWLLGIKNGYEYFGGATQLLVVDNTRCAVNAADWFDPDMNQEFYNFCQHYKTTVIAARPKKPKDKNLIEVHLGVFWRWVRRRIKQKHFFSLGELNRYLADCADEFNSPYQRKYGSSRQERFIANEKVSLLPLPINNYESGEWKTAKLHEDCHIQHKYNFYSAPYQHRGKELDVRVTVASIEIFYQQERIAIHQKRPDSQRGNYSTDKTHLPAKLQAMEEMGVHRQISEAKKVGMQTEKIITTLLTDSSHPLMFMRRTMGILRMKGRYGADKLERACEVLLRHGRTKPSVKDVERMIKSPNLADQPKALPINRKPNTHLRGQTSFTTEGENNYESTTESNGSVSNRLVAQGDQGVSGSSYQGGLG